MPALSWNEIRQNAIQFSREWEDAKEERAEAQSFWNEFLKMFGIKRRSIAAFEQKVKSIERSNHRIDFFIPGVLLAEHKSAGETLDKAESQAFEYITDLFRAGREKEIPRYIVLCNFHTFALYDLEPDEESGLPLWKDKPYNRIEFPLSDLHSHVKHFAFLLGQKTHKFIEEDPANIEAAQIMADLHDAVEVGGYPQKDMERLLVRLLFCLFADDTGIFDASLFELYIENKTREDGSNLGQELNALFDVLNTPSDKRIKLLDEDLAAFPFINGELFSERLPFMSFNRDMRNRLLAACHFDWSRISPAIFGSLFQGIMEGKERRQIGAHYTSERDIMKVIRPLFLDELQAEFEQIKKDRSNKRKAHLRKFQEKLASLNFLDPACGCGNFLVISYRELRELELKIMKELFTKNDLFLPRVNVHQFYGIEISEWPTRIAETALWLTDHQMNLALSVETGVYFDRIPLKTSPHILCANALRMDWNTLLPAKACSYVLGNPPFVGAKFQTAEQKEDVRNVAGRVNNYGLLDYVTMWYFKAAEYIQNTLISCAFVSTNSLSQGEQVGVIWTALYKRGVRIHFAHRTFAWQSEAKGKAHVHVVIVGFGLRDVAEKKLFEYEDMNAEPTVGIVTNINPYLIEASDITIQNRSRALSNVPKIGIGNKPIDDGNYLFTSEEKKEFLKIEPGAKKFFRPFIGSKEVIHGYHRWCLWLGDALPSELNDLPECKKRIAAVKTFRKMSKSLPTIDIANTPTRFHVENFPERDYWVMPRVSSERRDYIPFSKVSKHTICSDSAHIITDATPYHFGILTSAMHMAWVRQVCGRLKSDFRYSAKLVYNNFPWPESFTVAQQMKVEQCAQAVLDVREKYIKQGSTLADLYDPLTMPVDLLKAHQALDTAVDKCYRGAKFNSERERVEYLFALYEKLTSPLTVSEPIEKKTRKKKD